jgi:tetratricopeptide (TPR) repeat protein
VGIEVLVCNMLPSSSGFSLESFRARAEQVCREEVNSNPRNVSALVNLGTLLKVKKEYAEAEAMFQRALEADSNSVSALINLGSLMQNVKKDFVKAEELYRRALAINPNDSRALIYLGSVLHFVKGQYSAAEDLYRKALDADLSSNSALMNLGGYLIKKTTDESKGNVNGSSHNENSTQNSAAISRPPDAKASSLEHRSTRLALFEKLRTRAETGCRQELQSNLPKASSLVNLAAVLKVKSEYVEAEEVLQRAIQLDPKYVPALLSLGSLLQNVKSDFTEAEALYMRVLAINPHDARAYIKLGELRLAQGRESEAAEQYQRAVDADPSSIETIKADLLIGDLAGQEVSSQSSMSHGQFMSPGSGVNGTRQGASGNAENSAAFTTPSMSSFVSSSEIGGLNGRSKVSPIPPIDTYLQSGNDLDLESDQPMAMIDSPSRMDGAPSLQSNMGRIQSGKFFQIILNAGQAVAQNEEVPGFLNRFLAKKNWTKRASALVAKSKFSYFQTFVPRAAIHTLMSSTMLTAQATTEKDLESHLKELVVLMVDISGFTRLSDRFQGLGQEGIDALTTTINNMFSIILDHVESWGGDVVKFAGDAVIVIWESPSAEEMGKTLIQAIECARSLEKDHGAFQVNVPDVMKLAMADQLNRHFASQVRFGANVQ